MLRDLGLYIHIPFCIRKCYYCDFISYQGKEDMVGTYVNSIKKEIELVSKNIKQYSIKTLFIGGGTPSYIESDYIVDIISRCKHDFNMDKIEEISIEVNPATLDCVKLSQYKKNGINRISMGLQACQNELLLKIGRLHTFEQFKENYKLIKEMGFENINIDIIFGLPNQTISDWQATLREVLKLKPQHISCYSLKIEENTPFYNLEQEKKIRLPDEDLERKMYHIAINTLKKNGYIHYEISNFCLDGMECKHNLVYWQQKEYVGIGVGAHSYFDNIRFSNSTDIHEYIDAIDSGTSAFDKDFVSRSLSPTEQDMLSEYVILNLRLIDGVSKTSFKEKFGTVIESLYLEEIKRLVSLGLLYDDSDRICLTGKGLDLANQVMVEFLL